ncbi:hypothetical protein SEA_RASPUTIA_30 [Microbacterium phage Rasputia]|nr:hypothetical protein SEA_RASPUTIA_30 [Microbacterium phage Rasputia]
MSESLGSSPSLDPVVFDDTRHTWLCDRPCPVRCACHCHRDAPAEPDYMHGWVRESDL